MKNIDKVLKTHPQMRGMTMIYIIIYTLYIRKWKKMSVNYKLSTSFLIFYHRHEYWLQSYNRKFAS